MNHLSKFQFPSSYGLGVKMFWRYFHKGWLSQLISDRGVCRTAPATPGLLNNNILVLFHGLFSIFVCFIAILVKLSFNMDGPCPTKTVKLQHKKIKKS